MNKSRNCLIVSIVIALILTSCSVKISSRDTRVIQKQREDKVKITEVKELKSEKDINQVFAISPLNNEIFVREDNKFGCVNLSDDSFTEYHLKLNNPQFLEGLNFSPDGQSITYWEPNEARQYSYNYIMDNDSHASAKKIIGTGEEDGFDANSESVTWSKDGKYLAYRVKSKIFVFDKNLNEIMSIDGAYQYSNKPCFYDNTTIIYISEDGNGNKRIVRRNILKKDEKAFDILEASGFDFSDDRRYITYYTEDEIKSTEIDYTKLKTRVAKIDEAFKITKTNQYTLFNGKWIPDKNIQLYIDQGKLKVYNANTGKEQELLKLKEISLSDFNACNIYCESSKEIILVLSNLYKTKIFKVSLKYD